MLTNSVWISMDIIRDLDKVHVTVNIFHQHLYLFYNLYSLRLHRQKSPSQNNLIPDLEIKVLFCFFTY